MKIFKIILMLCLILSCKNEIKSEPKQPVEAIKKEINKTLDGLHKAASNADFDAYFGQMTKDAVFLGTDATENWQNDAYRAYSKPHFDRGRAWSFTSVERNIYVSDDQKIAWFDELLDTQMKLCRGSGILKRENGIWKVGHYVLSIAVPNENTSEVIKLKSTFDSLYTKSLLVKRHVN